MSACNKNAFMVIITFNINNTDDDDAALTLSLKRTKKNAKL